MIINLKMLDLNLINTLEVATPEELGYLNDSQIIQYVKEHGLYESHFSDLGLIQYQLFQIAKKITVQDKKQALKMMKYVKNIEYLKGYEAYLYMCNEKELEIDKLIDVIQEDLKDSLNYKIFVSCLVEVAISIVTKYPSKSLILFRQIADTYDIVGSIPSKTLELAVDIVDNIASSDIHSALKIYEEIVEIECFQTDALHKILSKTDDIQLKSNINAMILNLENSSIIQTHKT